MSFPRAKRERLSPPKPGIPPTGLALLLLECSVLSQPKIPLFHGNSATVGMMSRHSEGCKKDTAVCESNCLAPKCCSQGGRDEHYQGERDLHSSLAMLRQTLIPEGHWLLSQQGTWDFKPESTKQVTLQAMQKQCLLLPSLSSCYHGRISLSHLLY